MGRFSGMINFNGVPAAENETSEYKVVDIPYDRIVPNEKNFYIVDNVEALEESIEADGLKQPLEVFDIGSGIFKLIGGHRRYTAIGNIRRKRPDLFSVVPCLVTKVKDELDEMLQLVNSNATSRELTDYEKMKQIEMLKKIYAEMKQRGYPITGRQRDFISQELNISAGSVHEMENISSNAAPEVVALYKDEKISTHLASEVAKQPEDIQREFAAAEEQTAASLKEIQERRKPKKQKKTDDDYGETVIQKSTAEELANIALELADNFPGDTIALYGKAGKDTERKLKQALNNLKTVLEFVNTI